MIEYTEKGPGLHAAIRKAGHSLVEENGVWVADDELAVQAIIDSYSLDDCKSLKREEVARYAAKLRNRIVANISPAEMASWPIKVAEARAYAQAQTEESAPLLAAEALARGVGLAQMVGMVESNSAWLGALESQIAGADGKHRDAINACTTFEAVLMYDFSDGWPV